MIFCAVYAGLGQGGWAGPGQLLACLASLCLLGYTLHLVRTGWPGTLAVLTTARTVLLFTLTGTGLSPVLHQLTDTVRSCTVLFSSINVLVYTGPERSLLFEEISMLNLYFDDI